MKKHTTEACAMSAVGRKTRRKLGLLDGKKQDTRKNPYVIYVGLEVCSRLRW